MTMDEMWRQLRAATLTPEARQRLRAVRRRLTRCRCGDLFDCHQCIQRVMAPADRIEAHAEWRRVHGLPLPHCGPRVRQQFRLPLSEATA